MSSEPDGTDGLSSVDHAPRTIVVHDPSAESLRRLDDALAGSRLTARWVPDRSALAQLQRSDDCGIALVAVAGEPSPRSPVADAVAILKRKGYVMLCYSDGTA